MGTDRTDLIGGEVGAHAGTKIRLTKYKSEGTVRRHASVRVGRATKLHGAIIEHTMTP